LKHDKAQAFWGQIAQGFTIAAILTGFSPLIIVFIYSIIGDFALKLIYMFIYVFCIFITWITEKSIKQLSHDIYNIRNELDSLKSKIESAEKPSDTLS
jgi:hypothetical protein